MNGLIIPGWWLFRLAMKPFSSSHCALHVCMIAHYASSTSFECNLICKELHECWQCRVIWGQLWSWNPLALWWLIVASKLITSKLVTASSCDGFLSLFSGLSVYSTILAVTKIVKSPKCWPIKSYDSLMGAISYDLKIEMESTVFIIQCCRRSYIHTYSVASSAYQHCMI